jgi:hypothetical protein
MPVNSYLCMAFIALLCFWTVLYYVTERAQQLAESYTPAYGNFEGQSIGSGLID